MRNIFDQYDQPENRLTHALASCLHEDRQLLGEFVKWVCGRRVNGRRLEIVEQQVPGEEPLEFEDDERRGLPDAWIHDGDSWSLIIESKVASPVKNDQLRRHLLTARKADFDEVTLLVLSLTPPRAQLPEGVLHKSWSEVYTWINQRSRGSPWAATLVDYMRIAEAKMERDGYLQEGTLTVFDGIPFDDEERYSYPVAKRVLRLAIEELREHVGLRRAGADPKASGRSAITGRKGTAVWDYLSLKRAAREARNFTEFPHLTLGISQEHTTANITIPNGLERGFRKNLTWLGQEGFRQLIHKIEKNLRPLARSATGSGPRMYVSQRHYRGQRSVPTEDARLDFDLRTSRDVARPVKLQTQWIEAAYEAITNKRSNLQMGIGMHFPHEGKGLADPDKAIERIARSWLGCWPIIDLILGKR